MKTNSFKRRPAVYLQEMISIADHIGTSEEMVQQVSVFESRKDLKLADGLILILYGNSPAFIIKQEYLDIHKNIKSTQNRKQMVKVNIHYHSDYIVKNKDFKYVKLACRQERVILGVGGPRNKITLKQLRTANTCSL